MSDGDPPGGGTGDGADDPTDDDHAHGGTTRDGHSHDGEGQDHGHDHDGGDGHAHDHGHGHGVTGPVSYAVVTVSSTRRIDEDAAGDAVVAAVEDEGDEVAVRQLVTDDYDGVQATVDNVSDRSDVDAVVTVGGTGVTPDDVTVEAVRPLFGKELPGFGELFRSLSYEQVGTATVASRATAGIVEDTPVFCLPGSEDAARLGARRIVVGEASHLVGLARR